MISSLEVKVFQSLLHYYFTSSPESSKELSVIFLHYLINSEKVFLITFPSRIPIC